MRLQARGKSFKPPDPPAQPPPRQIQIACFATGEPRLSRFAEGHAGGALPTPADPRTVDRATVRAYGQPQERDQGRQRHSGGPQDSKVVKMGIQEHAYRDAAAYNLHDYFPGIGNLPGSNGESHSGRVQHSRGWQPSPCGLDQSEGQLGASYRASIATAQLRGKEPPSRRSRMGEIAFAVQAVPPVLV